MAQNFQSSFIPKEPITEEVFKKKKAGVFGVLAVSLFITSIIIATGLYFYKGILKSDIKNLEQQLADAEKTIDKKSINDMSDFSKKLGVVKSIVAKHQVISKFLETLASSTVSTVQFDSFEYGNFDQGKLSAKLKGYAANYASVAKQEDVLSQNKNFKSISFSDLGLTTKGTVSFNLSIVIDQQITAYSP